MPNQVEDRALPAKAILDLKQSPREAFTVYHGFLQVFQVLRSFIKQERGQDLVEYALVVALVALAATVGMKSLAGGINKAFDSVSVSLSTDI